MNYFQFVLRSINKQLRCSYSTAYRSGISLDNLYPGSNLKVITPSKVSDEGQKFSGFIPIDQLFITYSRSSGPGGQNVNKVNTKVEVRFNINTATWLHDDIKMKLCEKLKNKITKDGFVIFRSDVTRSQQLNLADCLEKIRTSVRECATDDKKSSLETLERTRRRLERATRERLSIKRMRSQVKSERQAPEVSF